MGTLFRAVTGFVLVLGLLHGQSLRAALQSPSVQAVKADIAAQHPQEKLLASIEAAFGDAARNGTHRHKPHRAV
jgi:hypothetical protein